MAGKGSADKKTEKMQKRKRKQQTAAAKKQQAPVSYDNEEICSAETCLRPAGT